MTNQFSVKGVREFIVNLKAVYDRLAFTDETRDIKRAEAAQAWAKVGEGLGAAREQMAVAEARELEVVMAKARLLREIGVPEPEVARLVREDLDQVNTMAQAISRLQEYMADGTILGIEVRD